MHLYFFDKLVNFRNSLLFLWLSLDENLLSLSVFSCVKYCFFFSYFFFYQICLYLYLYLYIYNVNISLIFLEFVLMRLHGALNPWLTILHQHWNIISYYVLLLFNAVVKSVNNGLQAPVQIWEFCDLIVLY